MFGPVRAGARIVLARPPREPGRKRYRGWAGDLAALCGAPTVFPTLSRAGVQPGIVNRGEGPIPLHWAREVDGELLVFFAHPQAAEVRYPMSYGQSFCAQRLQRKLKVAGVAVELSFAPFQSLLVRVVPGKAAVLEDIFYDPPAPAVEMP